MLDVILQKSYLHWILNPSVKQRDEKVIRSLISVDVCFNQRITRQRFKKTTWRCLKGKISSLYLNRIVYLDEKSLLDKIFLVVYIPVSHCDLRTSTKHRPTLYESLQLNSLNLFITNFTINRLWQKQAFGLKISFVHFSLKLINNKFWLKCRNNCYSIFMGSRDMNFIMLFYSEVQFRGKFIDMNRNPWQCMCIQP